MSLFLVLTVSVIDGRENHGMPCAGCILHSLFLLHYALPRQLLQRPLVVCDRESTSVITIVRKLARASQYYERAYPSVCRLCRKACNLKEVADLTLEADLDLLARV